MKINWPLVSIIIVNWNGGEIFRNCLYYLERIDYPNWELIIVDNGSTDKSFLLPQSFKSKIKRSLLVKNKRNLGFAPANNQGIKYAKGEYLLCLNNDTEVSKDFLTVLIKKMLSDSKIGVIQPKIFLLDKPQYLDNAGSLMTKIGFLDHYGFQEKDGKRFSKEKNVFSVKGACMLIRTKILTETHGLFDKDFFSYFEESDFCFRVWIAGYKVVFFPKAKVFHKLGYTIKRLNVLEINYHYYKNRICSLIKNLEVRDFYILLNHLIMSILISLLFILRLNFKNALIVFQAIFWNIKNLSSTLNKRKIIQKNRKINDREIFQKVMVKINWAKFFNDFKRVENDIKINAK